MANLSNKLQPYIDPKSKIVIGIDLVNSTNMVITTCWYSPDKARHFIKSLEELIVIAEKNCITMLKVNES